MSVSEEIQAEVATRWTESYQGEFCRLELLGDGVRSLDAITALPHFR